MKIQNLQDLASKALKQFKQKTRDNGQKFYCTKENAPQWIKDLVYAAHDEMLPDDYKYSFIVESLQLLSNFENTDDARNSIDADFENYRLLQWLSSSLDRITYVNNAIQDLCLGNNDFNLISSIQYGQIEEKKQVFESVLSSLEYKFKETKEV